MGAAAMGTTTRGPAGMEKATNVFALRVVGHVTSVVAQVAVTTTVCCWLMSSTAQPRSHPSSDSEVDPAADETSRRLRVLEREIDSLRRVVVAAQASPPIAVAAADHREVPAGPTAEEMRAAAVEGLESGFSHQPRDSSSDQ